MTVPLYLGTVCNGERTEFHTMQVQVQILAEPRTSWTRLGHFLTFPIPEFPPL